MRKRVTTVEIILEETDMFVIVETWFENSDLY